MLPMVLRSPPASCIQSIRYVTGKLSEDGLIRRVPRSDNRVLWEAVK